MAKTAVKNFTTQLNEDTNTLLKRISRLKKEADNLAFSIDKIEKGFVMQENIKKEQEKQAYDQMLINSHRTSYIMPDDDVETSETLSNVENANTAEKVENTSIEETSKNVPVKAEISKDKENDKPARSERKSFENAQKPRQDSKFKKEFSSDNRSRQNKKPDRFNSRNEAMGFSKDEDDDNKNKFKKK